MTTRAEFPSDSDSGAEPEPRPEAEPESAPQPEPESGAAPEPEPPAPAPEQSLESAAQWFDVPAFGVRATAPITADFAAAAPDALPGAAPPEAGRSAKLNLSVIWTFLPVLGLQAALVPFRQVWAVELLLIALLLVLPGVLLLRALRVPGKAVAANPVYVPTASLAVLTVSGLVVDLPARYIFGFEHPLRTYPLLVGIEVSCVLLMLLACLAPEDTAIRWPPAKLAIRRLWPVLIALAAALGALRLNAGSGNTVAVLAAIACLIALIWGFTRGDRMSDTLLATLLYAVGLAAMWAFSLRGTLVYGFDIANEYRALHLTVTSGIWHLSHPGDAYGALPSVTVLPAELHFLSGISPLMVMKLVYPAIVAMYPVGVFSLGRKFVTPRWAFAAAALIIVQGAFGQELSALTRQEISFIFFIGMLCAMYDTTLNRLPRWLLTAVFAIGMATSHYSTVYFAIGMLAGLLILQWAFSWRKKEPQIVGVFVTAFVAATVSAGLWYGTITKSSSNVSHFVSAASSQGLDILPGQSAGQNIISRYLNSTNTQKAMTAAQYQRQVQKYYSTNRKFVVLLPDAANPKYDLRSSTVSAPPVHLAIGRKVISSGELIAEQLTELLAVISVLFMVARRKTDWVARQFMFLGVGAIFELGIIRLSGTVAAAYNQDRAFLQAFAVLGIALAWMMQHLSGRLRRRSRRFRYGELAVVAAAALGISVIYAQLSGLSAAVFGGSTQANFSNSGDDYERYVVTAQDVAAAKWFLANEPSGQITYADRYGALRLYAEGAGTQGMLSDITPMTLDRHSWVYATTTNIVAGRARQEFDNHLISYAFPIRFLDSNFSVLYTNGSSEVFHG